jgi:aspartate beta-hydroxylase
MRGDAAGARALLEQAVAEDPSQAAIWPAHSGVSNTRLIEHLPLIVPPGCGFRVGAERREWHAGNAFIFDDTF